MLSVSIGARLFMDCNCNGCFGRFYESRWSERKTRSGGAKKLRCGLWAIAQNHFRHVEIFGSGDFEIGFFAAYDFDRQATFFK